MNLKKIVSNSELRFKTIEQESAQKIGKTILYNFADIVRPAFGGVLIGGLAGYFFGGDKDSVYLGAKIGAFIEILHEEYKLANLGYLYHNKGDNHKEYNELKEKELGVNRSN